VVVADLSLGIGTYAAVFAPLETAGRAEVITRRLSDAISLGVLPDGLLLPSETDLAERLGVATVTVREALGTLRARGMIRTRRGRHGGSFVCSPADGGRSALLDRLRGLGQGELRDLGDHYAAIGGACAVLASQRADAADVARLTTLAPAVRDGRVASEWLRAEGTFHLELAVAAQSARLAREEIMLQSEIGPLLWLAHAHAHAHDDAASSHERLARAVARGDATRARTILEKHVQALVLALRPLHHEARRSR
jgi:GntR family transcriptional regulator, transcriptional repressor for pyruvate dehydrogenase complex